MVTQERLYWMDLANKFIERGHRVVKREEEGHPYLREGFRVGEDNSSFNLGNLVTDNFFEARRTDFGEPESQTFGKFSARLIDEEVVRGFSGFDDVVITEAEDLEIDGFEFFKGENLVDRVLLIGLDYLLESDPSKIAHDVGTVDGRLVERREDAERRQKAPYRDGQTFTHTVSQSRVRPIDVRMRLDNFFYNSIPNIREREKEFRNVEIRALHLMGLNIDDNSHWQKALNTAFADVVDPMKPIIPFDSWTYSLMGAREKIFLEYIIRVSTLRGGIHLVYFDRPEGKDSIRTEYDRKHHFKIPGILIAFSGDEDVEGQRKRGVYFEIAATNLTEDERQGVLERTLEFLRPFSIGDIFYRRQNLRFPYEQFVEDLEWTVAVLDDSKLDNERLLIGKLAEEEREFPVFGEERDEDDYRVIKGNERKMVRFLNVNGEKFSFHSMSEFNPHDFEIGTRIRALFQYDDDGTGYGTVIRAATPYLIEK